MQILLWTTLAQRRTLRPHCKGGVRPHIRMERVFGILPRVKPALHRERFLGLSTECDLKVFGDFRGDHHPDRLFGVGALAPRGLSPFHRGLVRGFFPAPHHHDPNEMLPNFPIWVMVGSFSAASGALVPTRRKIQQIIPLTLSPRRQQMRPIIHSCLKVEKDANTVELTTRKIGLQSRVKHLTAFRQYPTQSNALRQ